MQAFQHIIAQMIQLEAYNITTGVGSFGFNLKIKMAIPGQSPKTFATKRDAIKERDELLSWSSNEHAIVVNMLLRPNSRATPSIPPTPIALVLPVVRRTLIRSA